MSITREIALEILKLPTNASSDEILMKYKYLALNWYPLVSPNKAVAEYEFLKLHLAAFVLIHPGEKCEFKDIDKVSMYSLFQTIFFKKAPDYVHPDEEAIQFLNDVCSTDDEENSPDEDMEIFQDHVEKQFRAYLESSQEKSKSEKKREKKKRRKEKKKIQKGLENNPENTSVNNNNEIVSPDSEKNNNEKSESEAESEHLDAESAFVSVVAKKQNKKKSKNSKVAPKESTIIKKNVEEDLIASINKSKELAMRGNILTRSECFKEAVDCFGQAILFDPKNNIFYGNRSYCYGRMGLYENALKDAEEAIKLCPETSIGYFRKGRALLGLKKYPMAEKCFSQVLDLDPGCEDAEAELQECRIIQIMRFGYSREQAEDAVSRCNSNTEALNYLLSGAVTNIQINEDPTEIFNSDDESDKSLDPFVPMTPIRTVPKVVVVPQVSAPYDIKMDPKNPEGHTSLWIGNVQPGVTEKKLTSLFAKCGEVISIHILPEKFCAFANFKNRNSPGKAMKTYQGFYLEGANLVIRFPNVQGDTSKKPSLQTEKKFVAPVNGNECYFWRTVGTCIHSNTCRYKHIQENKAIDKKKKK